LAVSHCDDEEMSGPIPQPIYFSPRTRAAAADSSLPGRLDKELRGDVRFDAATRGRYSTDASIYQIVPIGVVVPRDESDLRVALQIAREFKVPILPRGAGTSQCGQTVGEALVIDHSKWLSEITEFDKASATATVQPGIVLDHLNAWLKPHGLWFPVDVSTAAQATLGGMAGNNSCGSRSIAYGNMVHNVLGIDAILADGTEAHFGPLTLLQAGQRIQGLAARLLPSRRASGLRSSVWCRKFCAVSVVTTSTSSIRKASSRIRLTTRSISPISWSDRKEHSLTRSGSK
jgi:hypothetical protein